MSKRWLSVILALALLCCVPAFAEGPWDCPECGREGNTGNFCGGCGAAAPAAGVTAAIELIPGGTVFFGNYEQDNNPDNGPEPIEWIVLDVQDGKALLLSRYGLDVQPYHTKFVEITWEKCSLRSWLNGDFLTTAFSDTEQSAILLTDVDNSDSQGYSEWKTPGGKNTQDRIFLLSYAEANRYLGVAWGFSNMKARVSPTEYALKSGAYILDGYETADGKPTASWYLRSPGYYQDYVAHVDSVGSLYQVGIYSFGYLVRPALWIDLNNAGNFCTTAPTDGNTTGNEPATSNTADQSQSVEQDKVQELDPIPFRTVGNIVTFGRYEQDNNPENGPEPVQWIVLEFRDGKALLLSRYGLDAKPYHTESANITWEQCSLRSWLNGDFLAAAFSDAEQSAILLTDVDNSDSQGYSGLDTSGGNNTQDRVFLLSYAEANKYFGVKTNGSDNIRSRVAPTAYAIAMGIFPYNDFTTADGEPTGPWLLRSPGASQNYAARVDIFGSVNFTEVNDDYECVRPAIWIDLHADIFN